MRAHAGEPLAVHRMQAADQGDHVVAAQAVVLGCNHQVPVRGIQPRIEDLHGAHAGTARQPRRQRRQAAAADRDTRLRQLQPLREVGTEQARRTREQMRGEQPRHPVGIQWRLATGQVERIGQGECLPAVAGGAIVQHPAGRGRRRGHRGKALAPVGDGGRLPLPGTSTCRRVPIQVPPHPERSRP